MQIPGNTFQLSHSHEIPLPTSDKHFVNGDQSMTMHNLSRSFHSLTCAIKDASVVRGLALFWFQVHGQNYLELVVVTSRVICFKFPNPPLSVHCLCAQIPRKQTVHTHLAHEKETLEDFQVKHHKIHVLAVVGLRVQLLKLQSSGPNKIVFLKRNPTHT